jgi:D-aspartate ligase
MSTTKPFVPLLFAGDINVYSMGRAFHEAFGIKPYAYGKYATMPCYGSAILNYTPNPKADEQDTFLRLVTEFAEAHRDETVLLLGCGDSYVRLISANLGNYPDNVVAPYIPVDLMDSLIHKERFYELCRKVGVDYPDTFVYKPEMGDDFTLPFGGPFIIKPSNGVQYWLHPYPTQKKVYKEQTVEDVRRVLRDIYGAGYTDSVIIQNFIPGDDTYMRVLTNYSDRNGKVKMMCLGHVLLEEHTPHGLGNHAVIITEHNETIEAQFKALLEELHYTGFSNFDIKYDRRDGKYKAFEINTRQGRSNYYVTGAGMNLAELVVRDRVYGEDLPERIVTDESLWMVVPKGVAFKYVPEEEYRARMRKLIAEGKVSNPLLYGPDSALKRRLKIEKNLLGHYYKFAKYYDLGGK